MFDSTTRDSYRKMPAQESSDERNHEKENKISECKFYYNQNHVHKQITLEKTKWYKDIDYLKREIAKVEKSLPNP